jgi:hypothetical protein
MKRIEASFMEVCGEGLAEEGQDIADAEAGAWTAALAHAAIPSDADSCCEFRMRQCGGIAGDVAGGAPCDRESENALSQSVDAGDVGASTGQENSGPSLIEQAILGATFCDELEEFLQPKGHNAVEVFEANLPMGQS